jgi:hypothetical protein
LNQSETQTRPAFILDAIEAALLVARSNAGLAISRAFCRKGAESLSLDGAAPTFPIPRRRLFEITSILLADVTRDGHGRSRFGGTPCKSGCGKNNNGKFHMRHPISPLPGCLRQNLRHQRRNGSALQQ